MEKSPASYRVDHGFTPGRILGTYGCVMNGKTMTMSGSNSKPMHAVRRQLMKLRRSLYGLRAYIPGLRERHRLEVMVGPLGFWDKLQRYQLNVLQQNGMEAGHTLMDIGCGPLQGGVAFIKYLNASCYVGIDRDPVRL